MKLQDFEKAIIALNSSLVLDEVKLYKNHVRRFYGHKGCTLVMWDENGRGYSCVLQKLKESEMQCDTHKGVSESCYDRDKVYDLQFD